MEEKDKIPKNLITIWIGGEMPQVVRECEKSHYLSGYNRIHINNDNYYHCKYVDECVAAGKFGKACDYLRMYYLDVYGGIYIDMDTKIIKPFDDVLDNVMFTCEEENQFIANGIIGSVADHPMIKEYIRIVETNFIGGGDLVFQPGMYLWTELVKYSKWSPDVKIYPADWFLPYNHQNKQTNITENTHTYHYYLKSWK